MAAKVVSILYFALAGVAVFVLGFSFIIGTALSGGEIRQEPFLRLLVVAGVALAGAIASAIGIWNERRWGYFTGLVINIFLLVRFYPSVSQTSTLTVFSFLIIIPIITTPILVYLLVKGAKSKTV